MDAPAGFCAFCGVVAVNAHHLTGRAPDHTHLHPDLTVDLCHRHHVLIHNDLRAQQIDTPALVNPWTVTGRVEYTLRRIAIFIARYAQAADNPIWSKIAALLESLADDIGYVDLDLHPLTGQP